MVWKSLDLDIWVKIKWPFNSTPSEAHNLKKNRIFIGDQNEHSYSLKFVQSHF